jgi:hypothetical protein
MKSKKRKSLTCNPVVRVLKINNDGTAIVSTKGLRRIVYGSTSTGASTLEFIPADQAQSLAEVFNRDGCFVKVVDYSELVATTDDANLTPTAIPAVRPHTA